MKKIAIYLKDESEKAYKTLKDHCINIQEFVRVAMIEKARELKD